MIGYNTAETDLLFAAVKGEVWLVELYFATQPVYYNTSSDTIILPGGDTYLGGGSAVTISQIHESDSSSPSKVKLSFGLVNQSLVALTLGNVGEYRNRRVKIYQQLMTDTMQPFGSKKLRWMGYMDKVSISKEANVNGITGAIEMQCSKPGINRSRNYQGLRITHAQRLKEYPNDRGTEYIEDLIANPVNWLSVAFQKQ